MDQREELTNTFSARSNDGREFVINVFTTIFTTHSDRGTSETQGLKRLQLDNGTPVRQVGEREYQIVYPSGKIAVTSDDPNAP